MEDIQISDYAESKPLLDFEILDLTLKEKTFFNNLPPNTPDVILIQMALFRARERAELHCKDLGAEYGQDWWYDEAERWAQTWRFVQMNEISPIGKKSQVEPLKIYSYDGMPPSGHETLIFNDPRN